MKRFVMLALVGLPLVFAAHWPRARGDPAEAVVARPEPFEDRALQEGGPPSAPAADEQTALDFFETALEFLHEGDYHSAVGFLAFAHEARPDLLGICVTLAHTYERMNWIQEAVELLPCVRAASGINERALLILERVQRAADFQKGFEWVESEHFTVSYPERGAPAEAVDAIIAALESTRRAVMEKIGVVTSYTTPVVIYERSQFGRGTRAPEWASGLFDGKIHLPYESFEKPGESWKDTLEHEYVHAALRDAVGSRLPRWLNEGLATEVSIREDEFVDTWIWLGSGTKADDLLDLPTLSGSLEDLPLETIGLAHVQSLWMTLELLAERGWSGIRAMLQELSRSTDTDFESAFTRVYQQSPEEFADRQIEAWRRVSPADATAPP